MIPQDIYDRYHGFNNPYREILIDKDSVVAYEYSDQIPSWHLEYFYSDTGCPISLIKLAISKSELRGYYSFYYICDLKNLNENIKKIQTVDSRYITIVEEVIPSNERSINNLFWAWICKTISRPEETCIILNILPDSYRKNAQRI
jgi:hypothetical protein